MTTQKQSNRKSFADQWKRLGNFSAATFNMSVLASMVVMMKILLLKYHSVLVYTLPWKLCSSDWS